MRIALVARGIYPFDFGGREIRVYQLARHFSENHEVTVFLPKMAGRSYPEGREGIKIEPISIPIKNPSLLNSVGAILFSRKISRILLWRQFDVVDLLFYSFRFERDGKKVIATINEILSSFKHLSFRQKLYTLPVSALRGTLNFVKSKFADHLICVSDGSREEARRFYRVPDEKITTIKYGVDTSLFNLNVSTKIRQKYDIAEDTFLILYAGRLLAEKGVQDLIGAFNRLREDIDAKLMIVGSGSFEGQLRKMAREDVIFAGRQPYEEMPKFYRAANLFVLPSYWETQSCSAEPMACGTPVIATRVGGIPEIVRHERTGLLVTPGDIDGLEKAIRRIHGSPELRKRLIQKGLNLAESRKWKKVAERTLEAYEK